MKNDLEYEVNEKRIHRMELTTYSIIPERLTTELCGQSVRAV